MTIKTEKTELTEQFETAFQFAKRLHSRQMRKGTNIPYLAHLLGVTALVIEDGGDEDQAIAALLHDAVEDQGGMRVLEEIRDLFGDRVAFIVEGCTDSFQTPKPAWKVRKENYLAHLSEANEDVRRVSLADKLYNARSILSDLLKDGDLVWKRFNGGKEGTLWYYHSLLRIFEQYPGSPMIDELRWTLERIKEMIE